MKKVEIGKKIINFKAESTNKDKFVLKDHLGINIVIFFYPKDNTPGCTQEGLDFSNNLIKFKNLNTKVYGVSRDSIKSHDNFKKKYKYKFDLISDPDEYLCNLFGVIKEKKYVWKKIYGYRKKHFLLLIQKNTLIKEWRKVKVNGHSDEVLKYIKELA